MIGGLIRRLAGPYAGIDFDAIAADLDRVVAEEAAATLRDHLVNGRPCGACLACQLRDVAKAAA
jgi:hypothetical protein